MVLIAYRTVGRRQFCLYYNTDAARISCQRGPAFSRGAEHGSWDSVGEGCREALGVVDPQVCGLVRGELLVDVGSSWRVAAINGLRQRDSHGLLGMTNTRISRLPASQLGQASPRCHRPSGRTAGLKYWGADLSPRSPCPRRGPRHRFTTRSPSTALVRLARVEQPAPPRSPGRLWRPLRPFPLRFGQQGAAFPLRHDAGGMGMTATFVVALGVQQRVGVHRQ
jgi:hypothetical protein